MNHNKLKDYIFQVEKDRLNDLTNWCKSNFKNQALPSHDHLHHLRVWHFTKEILPYFQFKNQHAIEPDFIEALMLASFFHDAGMKYTRDERHGKFSKDLCKQYIFENHLPIPSYFSRILEAIKHHDDKEYKMAYHEALSNPSILTILNLADDLDAFGIIGIIRYAEIYLLRNISPEELSGKVLSNAQRRFQHFERIFKEFPDFTAKHRKRYEILKEFYSSHHKNIFNQEIILTIQNNLRKKGNYRLQDIIEPAKKDSIVFKNKLAEELNYFS